MRKCKIALIGHSGSGKTSCLKKLSEMDSGLGTSESPDIQKTMGWLLSGSMTVPVIVISVHKNMLVKMVEAKMVASNDIHQLLFVYLYKAKDNLEKCLLKDKQRNCRDPQNVSDALNSFEELDAIFRGLADRIVDTTNMDIDQVTREIKCLEPEILEF